MEWRKQYDFSGKGCIIEEEKGLVPGRAGGEAGNIQTVSVQMGVGSFT